MCLVQVSLAMFRCLSHNQNQVSKWSTRVLIVARLVFLQKYRFSRELPRESFCMGDLTRWPNLRKPDNPEEKQGHKQSQRFEHAQCLWSGELCFWCSSGDLSLIFLADVQVVQGRPRLKGICADPFLRCFNNGPMAGPFET